MRPPRPRGWARRPEHDRIDGGSGNDRLIGGLGIDTLAGGSGNDIYDVDNRLDRVSELASAGTDSVVSTVSFTLAANLERLTLAGAAAISGIGNTLANTLTGNAAANGLSGGRGNDTLSGGLGNDVLAGGMGSDVISGGAGLDNFRFNTALSATANVDRLADFASADDRFELDDAGFAGIGAPGALAGGAFRIGTAAGDAGDRVIYHAATGPLAAVP